MTDAEFRFNPKRAVIARDLPCRMCGYDVRGVRFDHDCPECGTPVSETVAAAVDPLATGLPPIPHARLVGVALIVLLGSALIAAVCAAGIALSRAEASARWFLPRGSTGAIVMQMLGAATALPGLWASSVFARNVSATMPVRTHRTTTLIGAANVFVAIVFFADAAAWRGWLGFDVAGDPLRERLAIASMIIALCLAGVVGLAGLARLLTTVGERSRVYREARGGRQGARAMNAALLACAFGAAITAYGWRFRWPWVETFGRVIIISSTIMVFIGLIYLFANAWWIMLALRRPALRLKDLVRVEPDTAAG